MTTLTTEEIIEATGGRLLNEYSGSFSGVSIDTRTISEGELFIAIKGERFDGHDFLDRALEKVDGAIVESEPESLTEGKAIIYVSDSLRSLQDLAGFVRKRRNVPVVAITGSNGKTTTKEMVYQILSKKFRTLKNEGNLNNHIGLPLSLLRLQHDDEVIVLEMGMNARGEIRRLCEIALPSHGILTNVGSAHIGRLGSREAVRSAKLEILDRLGVAVVNNDDSFLMSGIGETGFDGKLITYGIEKESDVMAREVHHTDRGSRFILDTGESGSVPVMLDVHGRFNIYNALAAAAVSSSLGIDIDDIKVALESFRGFPMRFEVIEKDGIILINDSYNSNPSSLEESVRELMLMHKGGRTVVILGDMYELDGFSEDEHRSAGAMVSDEEINVFIAVGEMMALAAAETVRKMNKVTEVFSYRNIDEAGRDIMKILRAGDTVLIKGSRSMAMDKIIGSISDVK